MIAVNVIKHRRMLYQGILIALPMIMQEITYLFDTKFDFALGGWLFMFSWNWFISCSPFVYLAFNTQLRRDVKKMFRPLLKLFGKQVTDATSFSSAVIQQRYLLVPPNKVHPGQVRISTEVTTHC